LVGGFSIFQGDEFHFPSFVKRCFPPWPDDLPFSDLVTSFFFGGILWSRSFPNRRFFSPSSCSGGGIPPHVCNHASFSLREGRFPFFPFFLPLSQGGLASIRRWIHAFSFFLTPPKPIPNGLDFFAEPSLPVAAIHPVSTPHKPHGVSFGRPPGTPSFSHQTVSFFFFLLRNTGFFFFLSERGSCRSPVRTWIISFPPPSPIILLWMQGSSPSLVSS